MLGLERISQSHVPAARWVDHEAWSNAFEDGQDNQAWSQRIGELGIRSDSPVVVYDDSRMKNAARIWWILRYWGIDDVRLLNGGWKTMEYPHRSPSTRIRPPPSKRWKSN